MDPFLFIEAELAVVSGIPGAVIMWLYLFSEPLREVANSARDNTRLWIQGQWSVVSGQRIGVARRHAGPQTPGHPTIPEE